MPSFRVGASDIRYELRRSATATQRRITVTPGTVEVVVPTADDDLEVESFLDRKRQWVYDTVREVERTAATRHTVPRFMTGSKIPYRGRRMPLTVRRSDSERIEITYRNGFVVDLPSWSSEHADLLVANELKLWLKQRARRDVAQTAASYQPRFGLKARSVRVGDMVDGWGSCGRHGNVLINWHLVFAPRKVLEYVVVHELAHLRQRGHGPEYWAYLASLMPEYEASKAWLDRHQSSLDSSFLTVG